MKYLLDTNTCIDFLNGKSTRIKEKLKEFNKGKIALCSVVKAELNFGLEKSKNKDSNKIQLDIFFSEFFSYPFGDQESEIYGKIRNDLERNGNTIGPYDLQIASIAISNDLSLVTHNLREFGRADGLKIEDWF